MDLYEQLQLIDGGFRQLFPKVSISAICINSAKQSIEHLENGFFQKPLPLEVIEIEPLKLRGLDAAAQQLVHELHVISDWLPHHSLS
jgi:hypothetical protein